jgi:D-serine deaminase-like pyridoxal phosphate-dependent protein
VLPNHACATCNMHDDLVVVEGGQAVDSWAILGRGKFK